MEILGDIVEFLFDVLGARIASAICAVVATVVAIASGTWYSGLHQAVETCNRMGGIGQFVTGTTSNCAIDKPLMWVVLLLCILAWLAAAGFGGFFVWLLANPSKFPKEV